MSTLALPVFTSSTGTHHPITINWTPIPGIIIPESWGADWIILRDSVQEFVQKHLWEEFDGTVRVHYSVPWIRKVSTGLMCYAMKNGQSGYDVDVYLINTIAQ